jgi:hypothetical protein
MWRITTHGFTFQEVLVLAAMNIEDDETSDQETQVKASQNKKEVIRAIELHPV